MTIRWTACRTARSICGTGLVVSCNAYFAQLAAALGPQPVLDAASLFGIDVARPQTEARLRRTIAHAGYGQGEVLVSPLKMARVAAAVAHDGRVAAVRWSSDRDEPPAPVQRLLPPAQARALGRYLRDAVTSGTGRTLDGQPHGDCRARRAPRKWTVRRPTRGSRGSHRSAPIARWRSRSIVENAGYGARSAAPIAGELVTAARELGLVK